MATDPPDGTLRDWRDVEGAHAWQTLLLGNGLSINIWPRFGYGSLFDHAANGGLSAVDRALFDGTTNFEAVLGDLRTAIRIGTVIGAGTTAFEQRYRAIQLALGHAVRGRWRSTAASRRSWTTSAAPRASSGRTASRCQPGRFRSTSSTARCTSSSGAPARPAS